MPFPFLRGHIAPASTKQIPFARIPVPISVPPNGGPLGFSSPKLLIPSAIFFDFRYFDIFLKNIGFLLTLSYLRLMLSLQDMEVLDA